MRNKLLTAMLGMLLCTCSTLTPIQHTGTDTLPAESKELVPVSKTFERHQFSPEVITKAVKEKKIILMYFHSPWCKWCNKTDKEIWSHPDIAGVIDKAYSFIDIDISENAGKELFIKYTKMFKTETVIPLNIIVLPRIGLDEDESVDKEFIVPGNDIDEIDNMFKSSLSVPIEGYATPSSIYYSLYRIGVIYNKKLKKAEPNSTVIDLDPLCLKNK